MKKVLLVSSGGGHWVQMIRLLPAFEEQDVYFCSTDKDYVTLVPEGRYSCIPDASRESGLLRIAWQALAVIRVLLLIRPQVVLSTGAAPGFFALYFAKKIGMKTVWVDSIANVDKMSLSGKKVRKYADLYLTQWQHLTDEGDLVYYGSVI